MKNKKLQATLYKRNAGESTKLKFRVSIPPKLRFDVFGETKDKTQSIALATVRAKLKVLGSKTPHYAYT